MEPCVYRLLCNKYGISNDRGTLTLIDCQKRGEISYIHVTSCIKNMSIEMKFNKFHTQP